MSPSSGNVDTYDTVDDRHGIRLHRLVRRRSDRLSRREVEGRAVPWADDAAHVLVPVALAERTVVVRAAVLDRIEGTAAVVDADVLARSGHDDLRRAGWELVGGRDVERRHATTARARRSR